MGAPPAPLRATIFFGIHKEIVIAQFIDRLQLYPCFIDDVLGMWLINTELDEDHRQWTAFVSPMQDYYGLEWIFEERLDNVNSMDTTIAIRGYRIVMLI